ncbi:hypothetical protein H0H81_006698 [Sphagnurus paluster]|uniref:Alpha/beta hydrolase fold-3 domain-containing protein n=1 Tax=Sphagnurus paluster TaxID=117069 RepID=A0A9P7FXV0_9AGAR|nr:hypothetical protein H0H81_006698 [Sphagnurus paluster]
MPVNALTTEAGLKVGPVLLETLIKHYFDRNKKTTADGKPITPLRQDELMYDQVFNVVKSFLRASSLVDAQWITARKDWQQAKRRKSTHGKAKDSEPAPSAGDAPTEMGGDSETYDKNMDEMRCGYYFGSVDQERYSIQRHARKINGRVFGKALINVVCEDLFLIRPPPEAAHTPVNPAHIVVAGDSAGGGISLALLQVIRDSGLPMPAGGVLISPWCDLTHSFSSVHTNTATQDVIPEWGLSLQKPSVLWPPPPDELSNRVHASLRSRIREVFRTDQPYDPTTTMLSMAQSPSATGHPVDVGTTAPLPSSATKHYKQTVSLVTRSGETLSTSNQLHLYTQNSLITHPLVSPVMSYLGGLPPLLFIASDKEVLRDEIIYTAHKAANPEKYPIKDETRALYPVLEGIEGRYKPTKVHLQVYDDAAHVLPVLFPFTTPAKFCFRAIATFCKQVTSQMAGIPASPASPSTPMPSPPSSPFNGSFSRLNTHSSFGTLRSKSRRGSTKATEIDELGEFGSASPGTMPSEPSRRQSLKRSFSLRISRTASEIRSRGTSRARSEVGVEDAVPSGPLQYKDLITPSDEADPTLPFTASPKLQAEEVVLFAGDPLVYGEPFGAPWDGTMIRERVSTQGIIRPLEPEAELGALATEPDAIGKISELTLRRYLDAQAKFDKKFAHTIRIIEKDRRRNLTLARKDIQRNMEVLHTTLLRDEEEAGKGTSPGIKEGLLASPGSWTWAWALDGKERPPPSSIASRRDTAEARRLAKFADQALLQDDQALSANRFWSAVVNFLTVTHEKDHPIIDPLNTHPLKKRPSLISWFRHRDSPSGKTDEER